jgi:site-specific recombinase XerD
MTWSHWMSLYIRTHCVARGLRPLTIAAYEAVLVQFSEWIRVTQADRPPDRVSARHVLEYLQHLREARGNGDSAINRTVVVLRSFYRAIVAMGHLDPSANPMSGFPSIKAVPRKLPVSLTPEQVSRLLAAPKSDTVIGLRDRALVALYYGTGIRASEGASLRCAQVDLIRLTITVKAATSARFHSTRTSRKRCRSMRERVGRPYLMRRSFDRASAVRSRAPRSMSASAPMVSARTSAFRFHRIAYVTRSPRIWCVPVSGW